MKELSEETNSFAEFKQKLREHNPPQIRQTIIFDLDGTLADVSVRRARVQSDIDAGISKNKAWTRFHSAESVLEEDLPNRPIIELYKLYQAAGKKLIIVSARKEEQRAASLQKLAEWGIENPDLRLRPRGDNRKDSEFKKDLLAELTAAGEKIELAVDDQLEIVKIWRDAGITCLDVAGYSR